MLTLAEARDINYCDLYARMYPGKQPKNVTLVVTHECNLRCSYCYEHNKSDQHMTPEMARRCIDALIREDLRGSDYINEVNAHGLVLEFIGGEPLLEADLIDQTIDYFRSRCLALGHRWATNHIIAMSTNGTLYRAPAVQRIIEKSLGRINMAVTIDGNREAHDACRKDCHGCGSYDLAADAFSDALTRFGQTGTKYTVAPGNVGMLFTACRDMMMTFPIQTLHINCVYEEGWNDELAQVLYQQLKLLADWMIDSGQSERTLLTIFDPTIGQPLPAEHNDNWCGGTGKMLAFDVDGTIYPCLRYAPLSIGNRPPLRIGDVDHGIGVLPDDRDTVDMLNGITRQSQSEDRCISCPIASGCGWCSAYNYEATGTPNRRVTYICPTHQARVLATSYYLNRLYRAGGEAKRFPVNIPKDWAVPIIGEAEYTALLDLAKEG